MSVGSWRLYSAGAAIDGSPFALPDGMEPMADPELADRGDLSYQILQSFAAGGFPRDGLQLDVTATGIGRGIHHVTGGTHHSAIRAEPHRVVGWTGYRPQRRPQAAVYDESSHPVRRHFERSRRSRTQWPDRVRALVPDLAAGSNPTRCDAPTSAGRFVGAALRNVAAACRRSWKRVCGSSARARACSKARLIVAAWCGRPRIVAKTFPLSLVRCSKSAPSSGVTHPPPM